MSTMSISLPNSSFDHLLELPHRDDSYKLYTDKWSNIGFGEKIYEALKSNIKMKLEDFRLFVYCVACILNKKVKPVALNTCSNRPGKPPAYLFETVD